MKKLAIILGLAMTFGIVTVNAQVKHGNKTMTQTTHIKSKKTLAKKGAKNYHMNKKLAATGKSMNSSAQNKGKVMSKGQPVYQK